MTRAPNPNGVLPRSRTSPYTWFWIADGRVVGGFQSEAPARERQVSHGGKVVSLHDAGEHRALVEAYVAEAERIHDPAGDRVRQARCRGSRAGVRAKEEKR